MNFLSKLTYSLQFRKAANYIQSRTTKTSSILDNIASDATNITNDLQDNINLLFALKCKDSLSDCKYSLAIIQGKLNALKPIS